MSIKINDEIQHALEIGLTGLLKGQHGPIELSLQLDPVPYWCVRVHLCVCDLARATERGPQ